MQLLHHSTPPAQHTPASMQPKHAGKAEPLQHMPACSRGMRDKRIPPSTHHISAQADPGTYSSTHSLPVQHMDPTHTRKNR